MDTELSANLVNSIDRAQSCAPIDGILGSLRFYGIHLDGFWPDIKFAKLKRNNTLFLIMSITLNTEQETIVANLIATGSFQTADEVLQTALRLLEAERHSYQQWLTETRDLVQEGIESLDQGAGVDGEIVVKDVLAKLR
jgi:antitoxin ParD1/3/4